MWEGKSLNARDWVDEGCRPWDWGVRMGEGREGGGRIS